MGGGIVAASVDARAEPDAGRSPSTGAETTCSGRSGRATARSSSDPLPRTSSGPRSRPWARVSREGAGRSCWSRRPCPCRRPRRRCSTRSAIGRGCSSAEAHAPGIEPGWRSPPVATTSSSGPAPPCSHPSTGWGSSTWRARATPPIGRIAPPTTTAVTSRSREPGSRAPSACSPPHAPPPRRRHSTSPPSPRRFGVGRRSRSCGPARRDGPRGSSEPWGPCGGGSCSRRFPGRGWHRCVGRAGSRRPAPPAAGFYARRAERSRCVVCGAVGRCRACGGTSFGVRRGGEEDVEGWAGRAAPVPVRRIGDGEPARLPGEEEILVGGSDDVHDLGTGDLDLVAILDVDLAERRPGLAARERSLATWMEAVGWARPRGRAIVQASSPGDRDRAGARPREPGSVPRGGAEAAVRRRPPGRRGGLPHHGRPRRSRPSSGRSSPRRSWSPPRRAGRYACSPSTPGGFRRSGCGSASWQRKASSTASRPSRTCSASRGRPT